MDTDAGKQVRPSTFWSEVSRVGFVPVRMELWAIGVPGGDSFSLESAQWPVVNRVAADPAKRRAHFRVVDGSEDPPRVEMLE